MLDSGLEENPFTLINLEFYVSFFPSWLGLSIGILLKACIFLEVGTPVQSNCLHTVLTETMGWTGMEFPKLCGSVKNVLIIAI